MKKILIALLLLHASFCFAQMPDVYPTNWWVGMKRGSLQLLVHADTVLSPKNVQVKYPGVQVKKITLLENPHYLVIDLVLDKNVKPGTFPIKMMAGGKQVSVPYTLMPRDPGNGKTRIRGVDASDFIYLVLPDRFSNGDPSNDVVPGMYDTVCNRAIPSARHGGDLKGIQQKLDYLDDLGVTALWLNPVIENDMPAKEEGGRPLSGFHGYWFTDHYTVDRRIGGNKAYLELADAVHKKGMKLIQDAVYNHVGYTHWFIRDLPMKDWIHQWSPYRNTSYKDQTLMDPYASKEDARTMSDGWFTHNLPDLNQKNPYLAEFLIQHAIWSTEMFGLDGWRIDTYAYNDLEFMNRCNAELLNEYPQLGLFGETWVHGVPNQAFFTKNRMKGISFSSNLPGATDFQVYFAMMSALNQPDAWTEGLTKLYTTLAQDFLYEDPYKHCLHLDNHDLDRFVSVIGEDSAKYKMGITWLLTLRGIPQLYYGTEILMKNFKNPSDDAVREDFPGGWKNDKVDKFRKEGRTQAEKSAFELVRKLAGYRKRTPALQHGKLMQYVPENGVYVYFRYDENKTVMVVANTGKNKVDLSTARFSERIGAHKAGLEVLSGATVALDKLSLAPFETLVIELR